MIQQFAMDTENVLQMVFAVVRILTPENGVKGGTVMEYSVEKDGHVDGTVNVLQLIHVNVMMDGWEMTVTFQYVLKFQEMIQLFAVDMENHIGNIHMVVEHQILASVKRDGLD